MNLEDGTLPTLILAQVFKNALEIQNLPRVSIVVIKKRLVLHKSKGKIISIRSSDIAVDTTNVDVAKAGLLFFGYFNAAAQSTLDGLNLTQSLAPSFS